MSSDTITLTKTQMNDLLANFAACFFCDLSSHYKAKVSNTSIVEAGMVACETIRDFNIEDALKENDKLRLSVGDMSSKEILQELRNLVNELNGK